MVSPQGVCVNTNFVPQTVNVQFCGEWLGLKGFVAMLIMIMPLLAALQCGMTNTHKLKEQRPATVVFMSPKDLVSVLLRR